MIVIAACLSFHRGSQSDHTSVPPLWWVDKTFFIIILSNLQWDFSTKKRVAPVTHSGWSESNCHYGNWVLHILQHVVHVTYWKEIRLHTSTSKREEEQRSHRSQCPARRRLKPEMHKLQRNTASQLFKYTPLHTHTSSYALPQSQWHLYSNTHTHWAWNERHVIPRPTPSPHATPHVSTAADAWWKLVNKMHDWLRSAEIFLLCWKS